MQYLTKEELVHRLNLILEEVNKKIECKPNK